jgi:hypothetical protein
MPALNADTAYGPTFFATALTSTFFLAVAAAVLGTAIARTSPRLRWHGIAYAVLIPAFAMSGFFLQPVQPLTGFALAVVTAALAVRLPHTMPPTGAQRRRHLQGTAVIRPLRSPDPRGAAAMTRANAHAAPTRQPGGRCSPCRTGRRPDPAGHRIDQRRCGLDRAPVRGAVPVVAVAPRRSRTGGAACHRKSSTCLNRSRGRPAAPRASAVSDRRDVCSLAHDRQLFSSRRRRGGSCPPRTSFPGCGRPSAGCRRGRIRRTARRRGRT